MKPEITLPPRPHQRAINFRFEKMLCVLTSALTGVAVFLCRKAFPPLCTSITPTATGQRAIGDYGFHQSSNTPPYSGGTLGKARWRATRHGVARRRETGPEVIRKTWSVPNTSRPAGFSLRFFKSDRLLGLLNLIGPP